MKKLNFKNKLLIVVGIIISLSSGVNLVYARTVDFSKYTWDVKETAPGETMGPGGNSWGSTVANDQNDVNVDTNGKLHLFVSQRPDGSWYSSEVTLDHSLGYGKYTFDFESPVDKIDANLVAAPFIYKNDQHELDIEYSYWQIPNSTNLHYTVQPEPYNDLNQLNQSVSLNNDFSKNIIDWKPDSVAFRTVDESGFDIGSGWKRYEQGDGSVNFQDASERAHINFWQINGSTPTNATTSELIVKNFSFEPYVAPTSSPDVTSTPDPAPINTAATTSINLNVVTSQEGFSFSNLPVTACPEIDGSQTSTLNAMCTLKQSGLTTDWSTFGTDMFLNSINSYQNNQNNNGIYWNWFNDLNYGQTALNKHILTLNESLLLTYDVLPLKITANTSTPIVGSTSTITLEQFGFDQSFSPTWNPATSSTLLINDALVENNNGTFYFPITSTNTITIYGGKIGFASSPLMTLYPTSTEQNATSTTSTNPGTGGGPGGNSNQIISDIKINDTVNKLITFIKSNQGSDGKIVDGGTSDWLAITFAAKNIYADDIKNGTSSLYNYVYNYDNNLLDNELNNCAAYPRHILGLLASGVSKNDSKIMTLKTKLNSCVQNNNFGQTGINDDVFGLIAAIAIGEDQNSPVVQTTLTTIKTNQQADGGFAYPGPYESADLTGAAINALKYAQNNGATIDANIFIKAKQYLKSQQLTDGGWGYGVSDALTTGWAMMGINALGENQTNWFNSNGKNPWYILTALDNDHFTQSWDGGVDWFGTKHAVPALLGLSWPIILEPKSMTTAPTPIFSGGSALTSVTTTTITTTTIISTSTTQVITTTTISTTTALAATTATVNTITPKNTNTQTKPEIKLTKTIFKNIKKENIEKPQQELSAGKPQTDENKTLDNLPLDTPTKRNVKKILEISGGSALIVGAYIGFRLFRNVI